MGFSSPVKAVLTTLKEAMDNSLDACEEAHILPEITVEIKRAGSAIHSESGASRRASSSEEKEKSESMVPRPSNKSTELVEISIEDNGPGLKTEDLPKVFGEYLASSKFGKGRCSRGQQGIGISAATTWAQLTNASGVEVISKTKDMKKAVKVTVDVDIKKNKGVIKRKKTISWDKVHGLKASFRIVGRIQLKGDGGLITYLEGTALVNPHLTLHYKLVDKEWRHIKKVTEEPPVIPPATLPHPHTMKLGEFISHAHLFDKVALSSFLKKGFSKIGKKTLDDFVKNGLSPSLLKKQVQSFTDVEYKKIFQIIQNTEMANPTTRSVLTVGEEALSHSIQRIGEVDFFSVITRKPRICDHKPVVVETAVARLLEKSPEGENTVVRLMRFANRVPLQFDKSACAITKAVESVNWRSYGLTQQKNNLPLGPYVFAVSVTSPFIKFKNASKETIDASEELVEEIRRALMQTGQKLARHIRREKRADDLERKMQYIKQFVPILVRKLGDITKASDKRMEKATKGIMKLLGQDTKEAEEALKTAETKLRDLKNASVLASVSSEETIEGLPKEETVSELEENMKKTKGKTFPDKKTKKKVAVSSKDTKDVKKKNVIKNKKSKLKKVSAIQNEKNGKAKKKIKYKGTRKKLKHA